jgi:hypothetical protein
MSSGLGLPLGEAMATMAGKAEGDSNWEGVWLIVSTGKAELGQRLPSSKSLVRHHPEIPLGLH